MQINVVTMRLIGCFNLPLAGQIEMEVLDLERLSILLTNEMQTHKECNILLFYMAIVNF